MIIAHRVSSHIFVLHFVSVPVSNYFVITAAAVFVLRPINDALYFEKDVYALDFH